MPGFDTPSPNDTSAASPAAHGIDGPETPNCNGEANATDSGSARVAMNGASPSPALETKNTSPASEPSSDESETKDEAPSRVEKAEQLVDQLADKIAKFTSFLGRKIVKGTSRFREAAQDFWAEAQNIRRGKQE